MTSRALQFIRTRRNGLLVAIAGSLIGTAWVMQEFGAAPVVAAAMMLGATAIALPRIAREAWGRLKVGQASIPLLVTLAAIGALVIGETWEAAAVSFLYILGGYLENLTLTRTRSALRNLIALAPLTARVMRDGALTTVPVSEVAPGTVVVVLPGDRVPVDGVVLAGQAAIDTSALTGEPLPMEAVPGTSVLGGSISTNGYLEIEAKRVGPDTTFSRMIYLVASAQEQKPRVQRFLDRFARWYTPVVIGVAVLIAVLLRDIHLALTFLVIACPGALVVAAPVAVVAGIGQAAKHGVLIKGGERLERVARISLVAFDKTGTLTQGKPEVVFVHGFGVDEKELLALAAGAEQRSEHHLAAAVLAAAHDLDVVPAVVDSWELRPGMGVRAGYNGADILVGNRRLLAEYGLHVTAGQEAVASAAEARGETLAFVAHKRVIGILGIADKLRPEAAQVVAALRRRGIELAMLTGDNSRSAQNMAQRVGITHVRAGLLPEDKVTAIQEFQAQGHVVAMVGDGVNDAPALAVADVSIAMGASGTQAAVETADLALMGDALHRLPGAIEFGHQIMAVVRQNVTFAVIVVLLLIAGVLGKVVHLSSGMLIHEMSVLLVIINGMRLLRAEAFSRDRVSPGNVVFPLQRPVESESERVASAALAGGNDGCGVG